ncbi:hypothetical protein PR048_010137 [Dryococelus australis]|uniref:Uncharacterized protein n=1 Tax=Dryococelus australis TaxID=614101 RepID=A0ABQ9I1W8_9NEOP|nr:hypothetical protein PR048_010137 [Dryococelus australis]
MQEEHCIKRQNNHVLVRERETGLKMPLAGGDRYCGVFIDIEIWHDVPSCTLAARVYSTPLRLFACTSPNLLLHYVRRPADIACANLRMFSVLLLHGRRVTVVAQPFHLSALYTPQDRTRELARPDNCRLLYCHYQIHLKPSLKIPPASLNSTRRDSWLLCGGAHSTSTPGAGIVAMATGVHCRIKPRPDGIRWKVCARVSSVKQQTSEFQNGSATVAERFDCSPPNMATRVQSPTGALWFFRKLESCLTMPPAGGFSWGSLVSPTLAFRRCSILISFHPHRFSRSPSPSTRLKPRSHRTELRRTKCERSTNEPSANALLPFTPVRLGVIRPGVNEAPTPNMSEP